MKAKYPNGTRVMTKVGHEIWSTDQFLDVCTKDIRPELTKDFATVMYTYGEKAETDPKYSSQGEISYQSYCLKFDNHGEVAWFEEKNLIPVYYYEGKPYRVLHEGKVKTMSIILKLDQLIYPNEPSMDMEGLAKQLADKNAKWIDVVIYEPLYAECDIRVCVKEKQDFYNNYKSTLDGHNTGT